MKMRRREGKTLDTERSGNTDKEGVGVEGVGVRSILLYF